MSVVKVAPVNAHYGDQRVDFYPK